MKFERTLASLGLVAAFGAVTVACEGPPGPPGPSAMSPSSDGSAEAVAEASVDSEVDAGDATHDVTVNPLHVATGPGLRLAISSAAIDGAGIVTVDFTVTDGAGTPLDYSGGFTDGAVTARWVLGWLGSSGDAGAPGVYTAYTTQPHTSQDGTNTARLPDSDTGGWTAPSGVADGTYRYTYGTKLPPGFDPKATHTVGVWATRVVAGQTYVVNTLFDFVPSGGSPSLPRDIVTTAACNQCHNPLGYHEGNTERREVRLCVLCHTSPATDVSNGNGLDMTTMVHKIHRGRFLPSVADGGTYQLTEDQLVLDAGVDGAAIVTTLVDHSGAWFPGDVQNCSMCHKGAQGSTWSSQPSRTACGACHDRTSFAYPPPQGFVLHSGGQQTSDSSCLNAGCHGSADHYSVVSVHATPSTSPTAPQLTLLITRVASTGPGESPVVHFSVATNGAPLDILTTPLPWLAVTLAGPTTDYAGAAGTYPIENGVAQPGLVLDGAVGSYAFTLPPLPTSASGSYAIGLEGYLQPAGPSGPKYAALNPVAYVAVTDPAPAPRRTVVERAKCNGCHYDITAHGGTRRSPEYCVLCHTAGMVGDEGAPRFQVAATIVPSLSFKVLVHKLHRGNQLAQGYVVGGSPAPSPQNPQGTPIDFGKVEYPGDLRACWACHAATSYLPPLPLGLLPTVTAETLTCSDAPAVPAAYCVSRSVASSALMQPIGAACTACHDSPPAVSHAEANTAPDGSEACEVCHGEGKAWDVQSVHALSP